MTNVTNGSPAVECDSDAVQHAELASCDDLMAKLSGLVTRASWSESPIERIRPHANGALVPFRPRSLDHREGV